MSNVWVSHFSAVQVVAPVHAVHVPPVIVGHPVSHPSPALPFKLNLLTSQVNVVHVFSSEQATHVPPTTEGHSLADSHPSAAMPFELNLFRSHVTAMQMLVSGSQEVHVPPGIFIQFSSLQQNPFALAKSSALHVAPAHLGVPPVSMVVPVHLNPNVLYDVFFPSAHVCVSPGMQ
jgi:hypothetical protein